MIILRIRWLLVLVAMFGCSRYRTPDVVRTASMRVSESVNYASALAVRAGRAYSRSPVDSAGYAIDLWLESASSYSAVGELGLAAVMFSNVAGAYRQIGRRDLAESYSDVAGRFSSQWERNIDWESLNAARNRLETLLSEFHARTVELERIGQLHAELGQRDSSLAYLGRAILQKDRTWLSRIMTVLERSPVADTAASAVDSTRFVGDVKAMLRALPVQRFPLPEPTSILRATADLEAMISTTSVAAVVTSVPSGRVVHYYPLVSDTSQSRDLTTADTVLIRPAHYVFEIRDRQGRAIQRRRALCARGCHIHFPRR